MWPWKRGVAPEMGTHSTGNGKTSSRKRDFSTWKSRWKSGWEFLGRWSPYREIFPPETGKQAVGNGTCMLRKVVWKVFGTLNGQNRPRNWGYRAWKSNRTYGWKNGWKFLGMWSPYREIVPPETGKQVVGNDTCMLRKVVWKVFGALDGQNRHHNWGHRAWKSNRTYGWKSGWKSVSGCDLSNEGLPQKWGHIQP